VRALSVITQKNSFFFPLRNWKKNGARKASQSTKDRTRIIINARKRRENKRPLVESKTDDDDDAERERERSFIFY
jgi:hypothetical protein